MLFVTLKLNFMGSYDCYQLLPLQKTSSMLGTEEDGAVSLVVCNEGVGTMSASSIVLNRIRPDKITK